MVTHADKLLSAAGFPHLLYVWGRALTAGAIAVALFLTAKSWLQRYSSRGAEWISGVAAVAVWLLISFPWIIRSLEWNGSRWAGAVLLAVFCTAVTGSILSGQTARK
jgi:hypothetical protein